jgi:hypothetical protein
LKEWMTAAGLAMQIAQLWRLDAEQVACHIS